MPDQPRPVWLDDTLINYLRDISNLMGPDYFRDRVRAEIIDAWDAAPADPAEAVMRAIYSTPGWYEAPMIAPVVLRALGIPNA